MKDFFITYIQPDRQWAEWIAWQLEEAGYSTVLQAWDFLPGCNFVLEMDRAAKGSERTIAVLSPDFLNSFFSKPEWDFIGTGDVDRLLPVRIRECQFEGSLKAISFLDLVGLNEEEAKHALLAAVSRERAKPRAAPIFPGALHVGEKLLLTGALNRIWNIPHHRNPNFTGQEEILAELRMALASGQQELRKLALTGLGGVGKTQIAVEYAFRYKGDYEAVWWVRSEEPAILAADYARMAAFLNLSEKALHDQRAVADAVRRWLESNSGWLLIFDDAPDPRDIQEYLPRFGSGHIIITSRNPNWGGVARLLSVMVFGRTDSIKFLFCKTNQSDELSASALALALGDLPLALEQAGAYISQSGLSLARYLEMFQKHRQNILERGEPTNYPATVGTTWEISFQKVQEDSPAGADLLNLCAFLAPDDIPRSLLEEGRGLLASVTEDLLGLEGAISALRAYSLIRVTEGGGACSVHRLVQAVTQDRLSEDDRKRWAEAALKLLKRVFPFKEVDLETWEKSGLLLPHALAAAGHARDHNVALEDTTHLLNEICLYFRVRAEFLEAKSTIEGALKIDETVFGPEHHSVARDVNNLGKVLQDLGDFPGARKNFQRALMIDEMLYGPNHPYVARDLNNLGEVLRVLRCLEEAKSHLERAIAIDEQVYGLHHPNVAKDVSRLGSVLQDLGDLENAKQKFERALEIDEKAYGPDHPIVSRDVNRLGRILQNLGNFEMARQMFERALQIDEGIFGRDHPIVARDINNLGGVLRDLGDLQQAKSYLETALKIDGHVYGSDHPNVARDANNLGFVLQDLGDLGSAKEYLDLALSIDEKILGENHPSVARDLNNLGSVLADLGDSVGAKQCYERALYIFKSVLGENHPNTIITSKNLAALMNNPENTQNVKEGL
jgi:tetratricopeptide (TPR) repeat protein